MIDRNHVQHIAKLARLRLSDDEVEHFTGQLDSIITYVDQLEAAPTEGIAPVDTIAPLHDALRDDIPVPSLEQEAILRNGPQVKLDHFAVPKVIG